MGRSVSDPYWIDESADWAQQGIASWIPVTPQATFTMPIPSTPAPVYRTVSVYPDAGEIRWATATPAPSVYTGVLPKKNNTVEKPFNWTAFLMFWADLATAHEKKVYCIAS